MNKIFEQVDHYMHEALKKGLPDIKPCELEKDGAVFYMNGKNGTAFDWYVNEHFPIEVLRSKNYTVYKVKEGGFYYVFWIQCYVYEREELSGKSIERQVEPKVDFSVYLNKPRKYWVLIYIII